MKMISIDVTKDTRFEGITPFKKKLYLATPTMHGEELLYMKEAYDTNWMSTVGENINEVEKITCEKVGCGYSVALSSGKAALHLAVRLSGEYDGTARAEGYHLEDGTPLNLSAKDQKWKGIKETF